MGTEREARALGAGEVFEVNGKKFTLKPVVVRQLCELEREALSFHKKEFLQTYFNNLEFIEESKHGDLMEKKLEEAALWDVSSLPQKVVFDVSKVPINDKVREWIKDHYDIESTEDVISKAVLALSLDNQMLTPEQVKEMTGRMPGKGSVRYDQWWITASSEGMARFVFAALRGESDLTYEDVGNWPYVKLAEASRLAEKVTVAQMGNG